MIAGFIKRWLPLTKIKIVGAQVLYRVLVLFVGKERRVIQRGNLNYEIDLTEGMELSLYLFGNFQRHVTRNSFLVLKPDAVIFDIGANVGLMTLQFASMAPQGRIYSFEPTFYALERLQRNLALNAMLASRVSVVNAFVSAESRSNPGIVAYSSWKVNGERGKDDHPVHWGSPKNAEGVRAITLNDYVEQQGINRIDLIKVDTDGHEYEVFKGADCIIARLRPMIIFEIGLYVMAEKNIGFDFYYGYFKKLNYQLIDAVSEIEITLENYRQYIPLKGSTDLLALPL